MTLSASDKKEIKRQLREQRELGRQRASDEVKRRKGLIWYFLVPLFPSDQRAADEDLEIQLLDSHGRGKSVVRVSRMAPTAHLDGRLVPAAVLEAARRLPVGYGGMFVDESGQPLSPQAEPIEWPPIPSPSELADRIVEGAIRLHKSGLPRWRERLDYVISRHGETQAADAAQRYLAQHS